MAPFSKFKDILSSNRCQTCGAVFKKDEEFRNHIKTHELGQVKEPAFMPQFFGAGSCLSCGFPFIDKSLKEIHEREHQEFSKDPSLVANHACLYKGGLPNLGGGLVGNLLIYTNPYKLVLKLEKTELILPFDIIKKAQIINGTEDPSVGDVLLLGVLALATKKEAQYFILGYVNVSGVIVEGVFQIYHMNEFYFKLQQARIEDKKRKDSAKLE